MVQSNKIKKLKIKPKISSRTQQAPAATPTTPAPEENSDDLIKTRKIVREESEDHHEKVSEIIRSKLIKTNERLGKKLKVVDTTKSL